MQKPFNVLNGYCKSSAAGRIKVYCESLIAGGDLKSGMSGGNICIRRKLLKGYANVLYVERMKKHLCI